MGSGDRGLLKLPCSHGVGFCSATAVFGLPTLTEPLGYTLSGSPINWLLSPVWGLVWFCFSLSSASIWQSNCLFTPSQGKSIQHNLTVFNLKICFTYFQLCACLRVHVNMCTWVQVFKEVGRGIRIPAAWVMGSYGSPDVGSGNWARVFRENSQFSELLSHLSSPTS